MSVIQRIQQKQKWVFGAIALALILFIVQEKFMSRGSGFSQSTTVGEVNGVAIDNAEFKSQQELYKQPGADDQQMAANIWQSMVSNAAISQEIKKLGLAYPMKEFGDDIDGNDPPQWFRQQFADQQTGAYNGKTASSYMNQQVIPTLKRNPGSEQAIAFQKGVLDPSVFEGLSKKYEAMLAGAVYIPKWMADKTAADNSSITNVSFVNIPYASIPDSTVKVSDEEINDYVKKHANQFEQKEETRQVAYVNFDAYPSAQDTASVVAQLTALKSEFSAATDVKSFVEQKSSSVNFYNSYLSKGQIHQPVNDSLFKLQPGQLYGPYKDAGSYVLAKMVDIKQLPDSARVRHILVATMQQDQQGQLQRVREDTTASKRLDSAIAEINAGKNFDSVCLKYSDDGTKTTGGVYDYFQTGKMVEEFNDFVFTGKPGEKKVVHTLFGYHFVEILGQKGSQPAYKIAYLAKPVTVSQETDEAAQNDASKFAGSTHSLKEFYDNAAKIKKTPVTVAGIKENDYTINSVNPGMQGGFGKNRQFVQWVYKGDVGDVSSPSRFNQKYIVAIITAVSKAGLPSADVARPVIEAKLRNEKKAKTIIAKIKGTDLQAVAQANNVTVQHADSLGYQAQVINGIGVEPAAIGAAFNKALQSKVSPPIPGVNGVILIQPGAIAGVAPVAGSAEQQRMQAENSLKAQQQNFLRFLIKAADVKDYRSKFY